MSTELFFVMIKPDGCARGLIGEIISRFERKGFSLEAMRLLNGANIQATMARHYQEHEGKTFYDSLMNFACSGNVCAMFWRGNIQVARNMVGATLPWDAAPGTIRGDFSSSLPRNLIHCSDSSESAATEVILWNELLSSPSYSI